MMIINLESITGRPLTGDTRDKEAKFNLLAHSLFHIASGASAYASAPATLNLKLKGQVDYTLSKILNEDYSKMEAFSSGIIDLVTPIVSSLGPYGVVAADLTDANAKHDAYVAVEKKPQTNIDARKAQNAEIHPHLLTAEQILKEQCDPIANTLFKSNFELFEIWFNGRKIKHFPHGTTIVEGFVYKADGVTGIYNALVYFKDQNIQTKTYLDGSYRVVHFPHGVAIPVATFESASQKSDPFEVKQGQTVKHNFILDI